MSLKTRLLRDSVLLPAPHCLLPSLPRHRSVTNNSYGDGSDTRGPEHFFPSIAVLVHVATLSSSRPGYHLQRSKTT